MEGIMNLRTLLVGQRIKLTSIMDKDISIIENWYNDADFLRYYDTVSAFPRVQIEINDMINEIKKSNDKYGFAIRDKESGNIVGTCGFENIQWNNSTATIYIGIGSTERRNKGIGKEALDLLLKFAFCELNLYKLQLTVIEYNEKAIKLYEKIGFIREGVYREFINRDGKRFDMYLYGFLRSEWKDMVK
jgi:RimJ/RimL family protein N-acetyltransferase